jgi:hypothetical protein
MKGCHGDNFWRQGNHYLYDKAEKYAGYFTSDNESDGIENAPHITLAKQTWILSPTNPALLCKSIPSGSLSLVRYRALFYNNYLCIKTKQGIFFVRVWIFWPRRRRGLNTGEDKRLFGKGVHYFFLGDRTNYKAKAIIGKFTNLFCICLFQIDTFINTY